MTAHVSFSQFDTYSRCGKRYQLERIQSAPRSPSVWLLAGKVVHTFIEKINLGEYPLYDGLDDGSLAVMVCRILSEDYPTPTPTEALQRKVAAPVGAYLQIVRRQQVQAEADRLASLGQLTPVFWSDDADTPAEGTPCKRH